MQVLWCPAHGLPGAAFRSGLPSDFGGSGSLRYTATNRERDNGISAIATRPVIPTRQAFVPAILCLLLATASPAAEPGADKETQNKALARAFYQDLWFSRNTEKYDEYVAETYVIHDIGDDKGIVEPGVTQKEIADFFWENGEMSGTIDFQLAGDDLVATRWTWNYEPTTFLGKVLHGRDDLPIINVFRFEDGRIVEIWNHRHDIDTGMPIRFTLTGVFYGSLLALLPLAWAISLRRRLSRKE